MKDLPHKMPLFEIYEKPWSDQVGAMTGSSWHLKGILRRLNFIIVSEVNFGGGAYPFLDLRQGPGGPRGRGYRGGENDARSQAEHLTRPWARGPANCTVPPIMPGDVQTTRL